MESSDWTCSDIDGSVIDDDDDEIFVTCENVVVYCRLPVCNGGGLSEVSVAYSSDRSCSALLFFIHIRITGRISMFDCSLYCRNSYCSSAPSKYAATI